ncbi:MAG: aminoacyl-tRNA hydrolase [Planctomycetes bacterium]|nr:aminoacyl-tRNA hydrolase [Planctomycetota bacterium]
MNMLNSLRCKMLSGPGGQNVNKLNTRVTVFFDLSASQSFTASQKRRIINRFGSRISKTGELRVVSQRFRTREANRKAAMAKLGEILKEGIKRKKIRKKTAVPKRSKRARLADKKRRSLLKTQRGKKIPDDE